MDISEARTESLVRMLDSHESLNRLVKVGTGALCVLRAQVAADHSGDVLTQAVSASGEPWQSNLRFPRPREAVNLTIEDFARLSLIQALSGFELYTQSLLSDICRGLSAATTDKLLTHTHTSQLDSGIACCEEHAAARCRQRDMQLGRRLDTMRATLAFAAGTDLETLFHYFRLIRNSLAHDGGLASKDLAAYAASPQLEQSWKALSAKTRSQKLPTRLHFRERERIAIRPAHAVMATVVCSRLAHEIDRAAVVYIGAAGMIRMAVYHGFCGAGFGAPERSKAIEAFVNVLLTSRYGVKAVTSQSTLRTLKRLGLKDLCQQKHSVRYPAS